jgi:hypothetical protein
VFEIAALSSPSNEESQPFLGFSLQHRILTACIRLPYEEELIFGLHSLSNRESQRGETIQVSEGEGVKA